MIKSMIIGLAACAGMGMGLGCSHAIARDYVLSPMVGERVVATMRKALGAAATRFNKPIKAKVDYDGSKVLICGTVRVKTTEGGIDTHYYAFEYVPAKDYLAVIVNDAYRAAACYYTGGIGG